MTQQAHQDIRSEAIQWRIRLRDGRAEDWDAFVRWLEADPARSAAYDAVGIADAGLEADAIPAFDSSIAANEGGPTVTDIRSRGTRNRWATALAAMAAIFLLGLIAIPWLTAPPSRYEITTAAGERKTVPISEGSYAALNGATRLILDRDNPRYAELAAGEATFTVRHDATRPFLVVAGDHRVQDIGTAFNIVRDQGRFSVEVIEGSVLYNPAREAVTLGAGQTLLAREGADRLVLGRKDPQGIAGWRRGQLSYSVTPLETVASDLSRSLGVEVVTDPQIAALPFTGTIRVDGDSDAILARLASTLGLEARRSGGGWLIEPRPRARR